MLPGAPVVVDPAPGVLELGEAELALAGAPDLRRDHEIDLLEDPDVLLHPVQGEPESLGQLANRRRSAPEALEDAPPGRVREGEKRAIEGRVIVHRSVHYNVRGGGVAAAATSKGGTVRKLVLSMGLSLDGLVARPGRYGAGGWGLPPDDPALKEQKLEWLRDVDLHLMGRVTYEEMAEFWPVSDDAYAAPMNDIPKVVFSQTLERAEWPESRIARRNLAEEIADLKREPGKDLMAWGGATFAQSLTKLGLVDEYRLIHQPVALGEGLPLFKGLTAPLRLELIETQTYSTGATLGIYHPAGSA